MNCSGRLLRVAYLGFVGLFVAAGCGGSDAKKDAGKADGGVGDGGGVATLTISSTTQDLGSVQVGTTGATPVTFTIRNTGGSASGVPSVSLTGSDFVKGADSCTAAIAGGGMCTIQVSFRPASIGSKSGTLSVSAQPGGTVSASLTGTGVGPGALTLTPNLNDFKGVLVGQTSSASTFTLSNTGGATVSGIAVSVGDSANYVLDSKCAATLAAGATCTINVSFKPASKGTKNSSLVVTGGTQNLTAALSGEGLAPAAIVVSPAAQAFSANIGAGHSVVFTVGNTGDVATGAPTVSLTGTNANNFAIASNGCVTPLAALAVCSVTVEFKPIAPAGAKTASLTVTGTPGGTATSALTGTATTAGNVTATPSPVDFGTVNVGSTSAAQTITLTNSGGTATPALVVGLSAGEFSKTADTCNGVALAAAGTCTIQVTFAPTSVGQKSTVLTVGYGTAQTAVVLNGTGSQGALLTIAPSTGISFGNIGTGTTSAAQSFTITNSGGATTGTLSATLGGDHPNEFVIAGNSCNGTLAAAATCTVSISFKPNIVQASRATLSVTGAPGGTASAPVSGSGVAPPTLKVFVSSNPASGLHDFGSAIVGTATDPATSFTVQNSGTSASGAVTVALAGANANQFEIVTNACGASLDAGASCVVTVRFKPTTAATLHTATLTATANGGSGSTVLNGRGLAALEQFPLVENDPQPLVFTSTSVGALSTTEKTVYIFARNANLGTLTTAITAGSTDFRIKAGGGNNTCANLAITSANASGTGLPTYTSGALVEASSADTCKIVLEFAPLNPRGAKTGTLTVTASTGPSVTVNLSGTAVGPLSVTPAIYAFTDTAVGDTKLQQFTVKNNDLVNGATLSTQALAGTNTADFTIVATTCTATLGANATCTVDIRFAPATTGAKSVSLDAQATISAAVETASAAITGTASASATITLAAAAGSSTTFPTTVIGNVADATRDMTFVVTNTGVTNSSDIDVIVFNDDATQDFTTQSNGCTAVLAPSQTCLVVVRFTPRAGVVGTRSALIRAIGLPGGTATLAISGSATRALEITSDADGAAVITSLDFGRSPASTASTAQYVRVHNRTANAITGGVTTVVNQVGGDYPNTAAFEIFDAGTCSNDIAAAAYCRIGIRAASNATAGKHTARGLVSKAGGGNEHLLATLDLTTVVGGGAGPNVAFTNEPAATTVELGAVAIGRSGATEYTLTAKNTGNTAGAITINWDSDPTGSTTYVASAAGVTTIPAASKLERVVPTGTECVTGLSLAPGATCNIAPRVLNSAAAGAIDVDFKICITGTGFCDTTKFIGRLETDAAAGTTSTFSDFSVGNYVAKDINATGGSLETRTFTITNRRNATVTLDADPVVANVGGLGNFALAGAVPGAGGTCANTVALTANSSCTVIVTFDPSAVGVRNGTVTVGGDLGTDLVINLYGLGTDDTQLVITPPLDEGVKMGDVTIGTTRTMTYKVTNNGTATSASVVPTVGGGNAVLFNPTGCNVTLAPGASCDISLAVTPTVAVGAGNVTTTLTATAGTYTATASPAAVATKDASLNLTAGATPTFTLQYAYSDSPTDEQTVTVRNGLDTDSFTVGVNYTRRSGPLSISLADGTNFYMKPSTCVEELIIGLDPAGTCNVVIDYLPQAQDATNNTTATIAATPGGSAAVSSISATSTAAIQWEDSDNADARITTWSPTTPANTPVSKTFRIENKTNATGLNVLSTGIMTTTLTGTGYRITADTCTGSDIASGDGAECSITIEFNPTTAGTKAGTAVVKGAAGFSTTLTLAGVGS